MGKEIQTKYPDLPGPVRVMLPQIPSIGKNETEMLLLIELAKSASTRNLIGTEITGRLPVFEELERARKRAEKNPALLKRIDWTMERFRKRMRM